MFKQRRKIKIVDNYSFPVAYFWQPMGTFSIKEQKRSGLNKHWFILLN